MATLPFHQVKEAKPWYGIQDPRQRKKIQDRLAQRARRRRLAQSKSDALNSGGSVLPVASADYTFDTELRDGTSLPLAGQSTLLQKASDVKLGPIAQPSDDWFVNDCTNWEMPAQDQLSLSIPPDSTSTFSGNLASSSLSWIPQMASDHRFLPRPTISIYAALYKHGVLLGITCERSPDSTSPPPQSHLPQILHPTTTQLVTKHRRWIDRFPFPRMRDNMIKVASVIDYEEFVADLFVMTSFTLKPGWCTWNPEAWIMGKEFGLKWSYLFY